MPVADGFPLLARSLVVGTSGHRRLRGEDIPQLQARVRAFLVDLQARHPRLPVAVLSSLAEGSDQLVAQVALDLGLRVIAPLPLPLELYRDDFTAEALQWLEQALPRMEVLDLPLLAGTAPAAIAVPGPSRDRQYAQAGIFVSDHCHLLLALWDGQPSPHLGGTAQVVAFHLHGVMRGAADRQPAAATLLGPDQENIVHHLPAARTGDAPPPDPRGRWLTEDGTLPPEAPLPAGFAHMFERQAGFDDDLRKYADAIAAAGHDDSADAARCPVWHAFNGADWLARIYQARMARLQVDAVIAEWIGTPAEHGQLAYYDRSGRRCARLHHRARRIGHACIALGVASAVVLALFAHRLDDLAKLVLVSAMGILSVAAAVQEAYMHKKADKELIRQYGFMQRIFAGAKRLLDEHHDDLAERRRILVALGEAALTEHAEWSLVHRERPLPAGRI